MTSLKTITSIISDRAISIIQSNLSIVDILYIGNLATADRFFGNRSNLGQTLSAKPLYSWHFLRFSYGYGYGDNYIRASCWSNTCRLATRKPRKKVLQRSRNQKTVLINDSDDEIADKQDVRNVAVSEAVWMLWIFLKFMEISRWTNW